MKYNDLGAFLPSLGPSDLGLARAICRLFSARLVTLSAIAQVVIVATIFLGCGAGDAPPSVDDAARGDRIEVLYREVRDDFPDVAETTVEEARLLQVTQDAILVDVRPAEERSVSTVPGSITRAEFEAMDRGDRVVIVYCTIGYRSARYAEKLQEQGVRVLNMKGSILSWVDAGLPLVDAEGKPTRRVHTYAKKWNVLPPGYEAVY